MFTVQATEDILAEVLYTLRRDNPKIHGGNIARLRELFEANLDETITSFEVDDSFPGSDEHDAHVHCAAVAGRSDVLLTCDNGWHRLEEDVIDSLPYEIHHPDTFFVLADDSSPRTVQAVTLAQARYWYGKNGEVDLPARLRSAGCPQFADRVRSHLQAIDCAEITT
jgi:hypothetical protein